MKKTAKHTKLLDAEDIAKLADKGRSVSRFFTNKGKLVRPVQRVNVDFAAEMLDELDREATQLSISRQAVIKSLLRHALDQHYVATASSAKTG